MPSTHDILFSDGEGAEFGDFNAASRAVQSPLWRHLSEIGRNSVGTEGWNRDLTLDLFVFGAGEAQPLPTGTARQIALSDGFLLQRTSNTFDPVDGTVLPYYVDGEANTVFTHAVGHATLGRWDLVVATLSRQAGGFETRDFKDSTTGALSTVSLTKRRQVILTTQLVAGTPAATPTIPATPGGTLPLYAVYVAPTFNAVFTQDLILDYRMPLGLTIVDIHGVDMWRRGAFVEGTPGSVAITATGGAFPPINFPVGNTGQLICTPSGVGSSSRLIGVGVLMGSSGTSGSFSLERFSSSASWGTGTLINTLGNSLISSGLPAAQSQYKSSAIITIANSAVAGAVATPVWSGGGGSPTALSVGGGLYSRAGIRFSSTISDTDNLGMVRFIFAGSF